MIYQTFPETIDLTPPKRIKFGIDPTYPRLHLGHFVPLRLIRELQQQGHHITIVLGTFTAQLGDPSGQDSTRPILKPIQVFDNANSIACLINKLLQTYNIWDNHQLHDHMTVPTFLRYAAEFTVAHMMSRNAFTERQAKGQSIGLHELLVPVCQGLDSLELNTEVEIGGQDQLFNFQIARQLQQNHKCRPQDCILLPIINGTDGRKMSKSLDNCIWLDDAPEEIYGKVMSISDAVMTEWYPLLTDKEAVAHPLLSKKQLAHSIVEQLWGIDLANQAQSHFELLIQSGGVPDDIPITTTKVSLLPAIMELRNCSKTEGRRLLEQGAVTIDGHKVNTECTLQPDSIIRVGRHIVKVARS
jgi:tyrosyl-tRNA synthetase